MKKKLISIGLVLLLVLAAIPPALAFTDISKPEESIAAESLASLGIIDSADRYNPQRTLTRAEFCKVAVLAAGFDQMSTYSSYTLFPDAPNTAWFAPYINAAVKKYEILKGDPSGKVRPNDPIQYGEALTILMRMLGYKTEDVGPFWPRDYIAKADEVGLLQGMNSHGDRENLSRGQAAILIRNLLLCKQKDGGLYVNVGYSATEGQDRILLSTWESNPKLLKGEVEIIGLDDDEKSTTVMSNGTIPTSLIGLRGLCVYEKNNVTRLDGFLADSANSSTVTVKSASEDKLETTSGDLTVPRDAKLAINGQLAAFSLLYPDIKENDVVIVYRDSRGTIDLLSVRRDAVQYDQPFIFGVDSSSLPTTAKIIRDGAEVTQDQLEKYDAVTYRPSDGTYYVSSNRMTVLYEDAGPNYSMPTWIKAGGIRYEISEDAAKYFKDLAFNKTITLVFDYAGDVAAAFPSSDVSARPKGVVKALSASEVEVKLTNGTTVKGPISTAGYQNVMAANGEMVSSLFKYYGQLCTVGQNTDGKYTLAPVEFKTSKAGDVDPVKKTMGSYTFASNIKLYERPAPNMPLLEITVADLGSVKLPSSYVVHAEVNSSGVVTLLLLENVTGNGFTYGLMRQTQQEVDNGSSFPDDQNNVTQYTRTQYTITAKFRDGNGEARNSTYISYYKSDLPNSLVPAALGKGVTDGSNYFSTPAFVLEKAGSAARTDFDTYRGVKMGKTYIPVAEDVQVYSPKLDRFLSLTEARANFSIFELYCDRDPAYGGTVRVIVVKD